MKKIFIIISWILVISTIIFIPLTFNKCIDVSSFIDFIVFIDPGHGGKDNGATYLDIYEDEINLSIAKKLYEKLSNLKDAADIKVEDTLSQIGGGSLPTEKIKSKCISIVPKNISTTSLEEQLRLNENPVVARISDDKLIIDMRCILEDEIEILAEKIINILK